MKMIKPVLAGFVSAFLVLSLPQTVALGQSSSAEAHAAEKQARRNSERKRLREYHHERERRHRRENYRHHYRDYDRFRDYFPRHHSKRHHHRNRELRHLDRKQRQRQHRRFHRYGIPHSHHRHGATSGYVGILDDCSNLGSVHRTLDCHYDKAELIAIIADIALDNR